MSKLAKALAAAAGNAGGAESDPNFNQVSLLLNGDGTDGGQNNTYTDSSTNSFTITKNGDVTQGSVSPFGDNWANYFDGAASTNLYAGTGADLIPTTGDFTIEGWFYFSGVNTAVQNRSAFFIKDSGFTGTSRTIQIHFENNGTAYNNIKITTFNGTNFDNVDISVTIALGTWYHFAITRTGTTYKVFQDGVLQGSGTSSYSTLNSTTEQNYIGSWDSGKASTHIGYISNFRISHELVYTSDFTPSTEPLTATANTALLTCQANKFVDNSADDRTMSVSGIKVTSFSPFLTDTSITLAANGGSGYFSGGVGGDTLVAATTGSTIGTGDFTIEGWFYFNAIGAGAVYTLLDGRTGADTSNLMWAQESNGTWAIQNGAGAAISSGWTSSTFTEGQWYHIAQTRTGGTSRFFVNGVLTGSPADSSNYDSQQYTIGGRYAPNGSNLTGYLSNFRIVAGTALYTANFTPPTAPLTNITNTYLLLNFEDAAIFDYAALSNLGTIGNADISTAVVKYGTGSLAFDGTGDYLNFPVNPTLSFGVADFTIEGWMNVASIDATYRTIFIVGAPVQVFSRNGTIECYFNDTDNTSGYIVSNLQGPSSSITANTWHYFTVVRSGTTFTAYVDGVAGTPATGVTAPVATSATGASIGIYSVTSQYPFTGYMDDFRITKGLARYTTNFTPPTAALPTF